MSAPVTETYYVCPCYRNLSWGCSVSTVMLGCADHALVCYTNQWISGSSCG